MNEHLTYLFNIFGNPREVITDRGSAFTSSEFAEFLANSAVEHRKVAVASPWANGLVERMNRFLKTSLTKMVNEPQGWKNQLATIQYVFNNTNNSSIKATPSKMLLGFDQRNHNDAAIKQIVDELAVVDKEFECERQAKRDITLEAVEKIQQYNKTVYDRRHKKPTKYNEGDYVMLRKLQAKPGTSRKLRPQYRGPYIIKKVLRNNRYVVHDVPGFNISSRPCNTTVSSDKLKFWVKTPEKPAETQT